MRIRALLLASALGFASTFMLPNPPAQAQAPAALTGTVTSQQEGKMEGVLVSAKKAGGTITISVVSDADGKFSFPASKLSPGQYAITTRAIGFDLNQAMLAYARSKLSTGGLTRAQVRHGDIYALSLPDAVADAVVMHQVLHFVSDPALAIKEWE